MVRVIWNCVAMGGQSQMMTEAICPWEGIGSTKLVELPVESEVADAPVAHQQSSDHPVV